MRITPLRSFSVIRTCSAGHVCGFVCPDRHIGQDRAACPSGVRTAPLSGRGLYLDAWILGLCRRRLLLGAGYVGHGAGSRFPLDPGLVGLGRRSIFFP